MGGWGGVITLELYLLRDHTGAVDELPFGEAVRGSDLQSSSLLHQEDAAVSEVLHPVLDLETDLEDTRRG